MPPCRSRERSASRTFCLRRHGGHGCVCVRGESALCVRILRERCTLALLCVHASAWLVARLQPGAALATQGAWSSRSEARARDPAL